MNYPFLRVLCMIFPLVGSESCFDDGVPEEERKLLVNGKEKYPLGFWVNDWSAGHATVQMMRILVEEKMGFKVEEKGPGPSTPDAFYAIAGCKTPTNPNDRGCREQTTTYVHLSMEGWTAGYSGAWNELQSNFPSMAPRNVGNSGYFGAASIYIGVDVQERAYEQEGLSLDFYRDYNVSWKAPAKYFASPNDVDTTRLRACNDTNLVDSAQMQLYATITGDTDGIVNQGDEVHGKCCAGYFWCSPACRHNSSQCLLYFTGGLGWSMSEQMQKATIFNMPLAVAVAASWNEFVSLPMDYTSTFYWWQPDPTFLRKQPKKIIFPPHDPLGWARGDRRSSVETFSIDKYTSQDLNSLAPEVEEFMKAVSISITDVDEVMLDQLRPNSTYFDAACRWLKRNEERWQSWLPDPTKCFAHFGMYNTNSGQFVESRIDPTYVECQPCPSGFFSLPISDDKGHTYICRACPAGSAQAEGASLSCDPCAQGEYQDEFGQAACKKCVVATYQDETGQSRCKECPAGTKTLGFGSLSVQACGCKENTIDTSGNNDIETFDCVPCGQGLTCPFSASISTLQSGESALGDEYVPKVLPGYVAEPDDPLALYECQTAHQCPGGTPGTCAGGLEGKVCGRCPAGQAKTDEGCLECDAGTIVGLVVAAVVICCTLLVSYYLVNFDAKVKASAVDTGAMSLVLIAHVVQTIAIMGMMSPRWSPGVKSATSTMQVFVLDVDRFNVNCIAGSEPLSSYTLEVLMFPSFAIFLLVAWGLSKVLGTRRWEFSKTFNTIGVFLQTGFGTMGAVAMKPLTCYLHPNGLRSLLKYPSVICGEGDHSAMLVLGVVLLSIFVIGFYALCMLAAWKLPYWSTQSHHRVRAFKFLTGKFCPNSWWFGLLLLARSCGFSMALVIATDSASEQTAIATIILLIYFGTQVRMRPWKAPVVNVVDMLVSTSLLLLIGSAIKKDNLLESQFVDGFSSVILWFIGACLGCLLLVIPISLAFSHVGHVRGRFIDLSLQNPTKVSAALLECAKQLALLEQSNLELMLKHIHPYDLEALALAITALEAEEITNSCGSQLVPRVKTTSTRSMTSKNAKKPEKPSELEEAAEADGEGAIAEMQSISNDVESIVTDNDPELEEVVKVYLD
ncbi:unnamed protein product [Durusdinium trenchii]|uniref:Uncharacterized protein n=2 Tax=Durusdinium trenchii TaxID=1381693 RepID=A0ABP0Q142_9DINO